MKKSVKMMIMIFLLAIMIVPSYIVHATQTIKIERKTYIKTGTREEAKFYTEKGYAYCITPNRSGADQGTTLNYMSKEEKGGVLYLLEKAGTSDKEYLETQLAIWLLRDNYMPDYYYKNPNIEVVKKAKTLLEEAKKQGNYTSKQPTITLTLDNSTITNTEDNYYYSQLVIIKTENNSQKPIIELINAPEKAEIVQVDVKESNTQKVYVKVPETSISEIAKFKIKVVAKGTINKVERYTTGNIDLQDLVILAKEEKETSKTIDLTITPKKRTCEIFNGKYYDKNGYIVDKEEYEKQCIHKCEHIDNTFYDKNGIITTEENYSLQCITHTCEIIGNRFFGKNGIEVSEMEYKAQCEPQQVIVPDTNTSQTKTLLALLLGSIFLGSAIGATTYYHNKIEK